jgi:hypothetical protein
MNLYDMNHQLSLSLHVMDLLAQEKELFQTAFMGSQESI